ncbi:Oosporein biosynthesis 4 [Hyphodiscus hymeniophilus]|uniref:Oosporein biosynthesis 4 n=1 Tax=Hyphodiscus hymeniophilus TaxID=353542 RepID=A0A9P6VRB8_9HELO|nr:Oosporein biosynthesis 4 [Hyphodiscus hymeniophilus]
MKVIIVGCGLGGLSCAISCLKEGLQVTILERAPEILPVGAGIQIPPNATRVLNYYGLEEQLEKSGAIRIEDRLLRRYSDGRILCIRPGGKKMVEDFGFPYYVIHRADYQNLLIEEVLRQGADLRMGAEVVDVTFGASPTVTLRNGQILDADVIVGADGLWSHLREQVLGHPNPPEETGDLAYRGTFSRTQLENFQDPIVDAIINDNKQHLWMGPGKHCSFYPVRGGTEFNLVLLRPDNLPAGARTAAGDVLEMRSTFDDWDPALQKIISCMDSVLKWKLCHMHELDTWVKGHVALLGDACHPSLPYQAQGAAMAVEDGCVLGILLGRANRESSNAAELRRNLPSILDLYESLRKSRTTVNVKGSIRNRTMFHMPDGEEQRARDEALAKVTWKEPCVWQWGDIGYLKKLNGFDVIKDTNRVFDQWVGHVAKI